MLNPDKRFDMIMKTLGFHSKILIDDEGQLVIIAQVVVPEHADEPKLTKEKLQGQNEIQMTKHVFSAGQFQEGKITCIVMTAR